MLWNTPQLKQCKRQLGQLLLSNEQELFFVNQDFGHLSQGRAVAVCTAHELASLQKFLQFASQHRLPITIRANGLSQSGQSLAIEGGVSLEIRDLNATIRVESTRVSAGCSATWKEIIKNTLQEDKLPTVFPYNTNLSLGGVLSVGGVGSSSFKKGILATHVSELEVVLANGELVTCTKENHADLFNACLSGAGLFGVIYSAVLDLRPCKSHVSVINLLYDNYQHWLNDQFILKDHCDYLEAYISPEYVGESQKACVLQLGIEYDNQAPSLDFFKQLNFIKEISSENKSIWDYVIRHDGRLSSMRETGAWEEYHPWYECYLDARLLTPHLPTIVNLLDKAIGGIYHIFPIANYHPKYFMVPNSSYDVTFNVLSPGITAERLPEAITVLREIDRLLLSIGGKRYISGWIPQECNEDFWKHHYGIFWEERKQTKLTYDPATIFCSQLFPFRRISSC